MLPMERKVGLMMMTLVMLKTVNHHTGRQQEVLIRPIPTRNRRLGKRSLFRRRKNGRASSQLGSKYEDQLDMLIFYSTRFIYFFCNAINVICNLNKIFIVSSFILFIDILD